VTPTSSEHKEFVQAAWRDATPDLIVEYKKRLATDEATIEDLRKAIDMANRITGAEVDKKVDPNAGLSVFNFTFTNGGISAVPVVELPAADITDVTPRPPRKKKQPAALASPTPPAPEMSMDDMMAGLDEMLGVTDD
jgi:hypothetical protein